MNGFREGYKFFETHAANFYGFTDGVEYINAINVEIEKCIKNLNQFNSTGARVDTLKGDIAEFWHGGTFNINAAINTSKNRVVVNRSNAFASVDISGDNFNAKYSLKYYKDGISSANQQAKSLHHSFREYQSKGGKDDCASFLEKRNFSKNTPLETPVYDGQMRLIPSDQMEEAISHLNRKVIEESEKRPEQVERYMQTLKFLTDRVRDNEGNESIPLTEEESRELARLVKNSGLTAEELHLTTEALVQYRHILSKAYKAGLTAATISMVLRMAPEIWSTIHFLIENGEIDPEEFKKIGFDAISGFGEGFIRGSISAAILSSCQAGLCGATLKSIDPTIVGAVTVMVMNSMKNAYQVSIGKMKKEELVKEMVREMFVTTCSLSLGAVSQAFIEIPIFGFMLGSFVGSIAGSIIYSASYSPVLAFCVDSGFTFFGLVEQNYELPEEVLKEIGIEVFDYEKFEYNFFEVQKFEFGKFETKNFEYQKFKPYFLRRGVIGVDCIGYV